MATTMSSASSGNLLIFIEGKRYELIIRTRSDGHISAEQLAELQLRTIGTWLRTMRAIINGMMDIGEHVSPMQQLGIDHTPQEPYCTVWNKTYDDVSITVHSHDNGQAALDCVVADDMALTQFREAMPQLFQRSTTNGNNDNSSTPDEASAPPQQNSNGQHPTATLPVTGSAWVREMRSGIASGLVAFESGKSDAPSFDKQAIVAQDYHHSDPVELPAGVGGINYAAYALSGEVKVHEFDGALTLGIETADGKMIWVKDRGGEHNYDWSKLTKALSLDTERLEAGQVGFVPASHIVMKLSDNGDKQYKNFYGLYVFNDEAIREGVGQQSRVSADIPF